MKKCLSIILCLSLLCVIFSCAFAEATEENGVVTVENYNRTMTFKDVPERIVSLSYSETEILVALGLADKIVGIAEADNVVEECLPEYQETIAAFNNIGPSAQGGVPSFEVLLSVEPDFVYATSYSLNAEYGVAELTDFESNDIDVYVATSTYKTGCTIEDTYQDIRNIASIFHVEDKGEELIASMQANIAGVEEAVSQVEKPLSVFVFVAGNESRCATNGALALANSLIESAGGVNVFASEQNATFPVGWESVVEANPDVIVLCSSTGGAGMTDAAEKIALIKSLPELQDVEAVKNDRFIEVPYYIIGFSCVQNDRAVQIIAEGLYPELFE